MIAIGGMSKPNLYNMNTYYVYILKCNDNSYYVGVTNNIDGRLASHQTGEIPTCYTYKRRPVELVYFERFHNINNAIAYEKQVKGWSCKKKEALIEGSFEKLKLYSKNYTQFGKPTIN